MIYFWSDPHFNHEGIIGYCGRPFKTVEEMNSVLTDKWNSTVSNKDTIYLLGDFGFPPKQGKGDSLESIFLRLNGWKHLIRGNHDWKNPKVLALPWSSQQDLGRVKMSGKRAEVCHYPLESWRGAAGGTLMLHGHSHGNLKRVVPHRFDVGVDVFSAPISFEELYEKAQTQKFIPSDHHGDL